MCEFWFCCMELFFTVHNESNRSSMPGQWTAFAGAYITHKASYPLSDIIGGDLSDDMQLPLKPQKALHYIFFTYSVLLPKTCEHSHNDEYWEENESFITNVH